MRPNLVVRLPLIVTLALCPNLAVGAETADDGNHPCVGGAGDVLRCVQGGTPRFRGRCDGPIGHVLCADKAGTVSCRELPLDAVQLRPTIEGDWWQVAGNPDLGQWTSDEQEPVDFAVWRAADGTWQLWSCIRKTKHPGFTRVFFAWEGRQLTDSHWKPKGITFTGDGTVGERVGAMQAPHVIRVDDQYRMYYGDSRFICLALSRDGKTFQRHLTHGTVGLFTEGPTALARDPMLLPVGPRWHLYYAAHRDQRHGIYLRTSTDLLNFSEPVRVLTGGQAGEHWWNFECPHVVRVGGCFYLFCTQDYAPDRQQTSVYRSADPTHFGVNDDSNFVGRLPVAAPELIHHEGQWYVAALNAELDGIRIARLNWVEAPRPEE